MTPNLIELPVSFHLPSGKIYDARNFEVAVVKTFASSDEARLEIGEFIADAMNQANELLKRQSS